MFGRSEFERRAKNQLAQPFIKLLIRAYDIGLRPQNEARSRSVSAFSEKKPSAVELMKVLRTGPE
jgi:hypothetical protein